MSIDSEEGMALLDKWYFRWVELIRHLRNKTNFITADIIGGFDSRVVSALWLSANINLNNILIYSSKSNKKRFMEDFEIANEIANHFDFKLNQHRPIKIIPLKLIESLNRPPYVELGFHKHRVSPTITYELPHYRISGHCGGLIRNHPNQTFEEYIEKILNRSKKLDEAAYESTKKLVDLKMDEFCAKYELDKNSRELSALYYKDTRNRYHFGKEWIDSYLYNKITIAPLSDPDLSKIKANTEKCEDDLLLITIIFLRYCPELLNFKIEGDCEIKKETIQHASEINERYPFIPKKFEYIQGPEPDININNKPKFHTSDEIKKIFEDIFYSKNFVKEFEKYYNPRIYDKFRRRLKYNKGSPLDDVYASIDILKIHDYVKINHTLNTNSYGEWLNSFDTLESVNEELRIEGNNLKMEKLLKKYHTLRIDVKNVGFDNNDLEILEKSDKYSIETTPEWFGKSKGIGHVIKTTKPIFDVKFKVINDGMFNIRLRGNDIRDINGKKFPVFIDCKKFEINNESILEENLLVSHEDPYFFEKEVTNGDILSIHIEWLPFNSKSVYKTEELDMLRHTVDTEIFNFDNLVKRTKQVIKKEK